MPTVVNGFLWLNVYLSFVLCFVSQLLEEKKNTDQNFILLLSGHPWTSSAGATNCLNAKTSSLFLSPVIVWYAAKVVFALDISFQFGKLSDLLLYVLIV